MDAVEIDPEIVSIAKKFFKLKDHPSTNIFTDDATNFIYTTQKTYDVIYMDAFLKPTQETDSTGVAQKLKAPSFLQKLKTKLNKNGIVVFNINNHEKMQNDIKTIRQEFSNIYFFQKNRSGNLIVIGSTDTEKISIDKMLLAAKDLDKKNKVNFSFSDIAKYYKENFE